MIKRKTTFQVTQTTDLLDTRSFLFNSNLTQECLQGPLLRPTKTSSNETLLEKDNETGEGQTKDKKKKVSDGVM